MLLADVSCSQVSLLFEEPVQLFICTRTLHKAYMEEYFKQVGDTFVF